jgi:hypothetical protein
MQTACGWVQKVSGGRESDRGPRSDVRMTIYAAVVRAVLIAEAAVSARRDSA